MGHYYCPITSELHECDLRVAKKENLYPSITGILQMQNKPGLTYYFKQQAALAALTLPRRENESDDDFVKRIIMDSDSDKQGAADIGSLVHYWIEQYLTTKKEPFESDLNNVFQIFHSVKKWLDVNISEVIYTEKTFVNEDFGYGCKIDLLAKNKFGELVLIDFKTQKVKPDAKGRQNPVFYLASYCAQLAAQHHSMNLNDDDICRLLSVVVSSISGVDGDYPVFEKEWDYEEKRKGWEIFKACRILHNIEKGL